MSKKENEATIQELINFLWPYIDPIIRRINVDRFTTADFVMALNMDPESAAAYDEAVRRWPDDERISKLVIHGQVIPVLLRRSALVEWGGFAHGEEDPYGVPAWWNKTASP